MLETVWVEIPVKDIERALKFYQAVFKLGAVEIAEDGTRRTAILFNGSEEGKPGVSLNQTQNFEPSDKDVYLYLNTGEDFDGHLNRVEPAGGKIVVPKTSMGAMGNYATIHDTEGNAWGLYSMK